MAERLTAHAPVLYVDPPVSHLTRFNKPAVADSLSGRVCGCSGPGWRGFTPIVPPKPDASGDAGASRHGSPAASSARPSRELGGSVDAVSPRRLFADAYGVCGERRRVYWWQDDPIGAARTWVAGPAGAPRSGSRRPSDGSGRGRLGDLIVAVNEAAVARSVGARTCRPSYLPERLRRRVLRRRSRSGDAAADVALRRAPIAGFIGHLNSRTDLALLEAVAERGISLLLIGSRIRLSSPSAIRAPRGAPQRQPPRRAAVRSLRSYLKVIDVGLVPYGDTEFNKYSFPLKTLEYLAAGRPVVATSLPAIRSLDTDLVTLADTPAAFLDAPVPPVP